MATLTEGRHAGEFLVSECDEGFISREAITIASGKLVVGAVLGRIETGSATAAATAGNTGNGVMGAITEHQGIQAGNYVLTIKKAVANAGDFQVVSPQGHVVGIGSVGAAFNGGGLAFTLADGSTDFIVGDSFVINVAEGSKEYVEHNPAAIDGSEKAVGILFDAVDATLSAQPGVAIVRMAEVNGDEITWKTGISAPAKAAGIESLKALSVIVR
ncbi:MAG: head decoration protein [Methylobacter sp.]